MQKKIIPLLILILTTAVAAQVPTYTLDCILPAPDCRSVDMSPDGTKICANFDVAPLGGGRGYRIFDAYTYFPIRDCSLSGVPWTGLFSSDSDYVWTTIYYGGYLKKIDYIDCSVAHSSDLGSWTEGLAFDSQRRYLYVGENNPGGYAIGTLQKFDTDTNSVDWSVTLNGEPGRCIVVGPDDQFVYQVTHNAGTEMLYKIRTSDGNVEYTRDVNGVLLPGISVSPDGGTVYVPYADANLVYVIETATLTILDTWPIDSPDGFFVSPDGTHAIVIYRNSPDIRVFDLLSESVVQTIDVGNVGTYSFCSKTPYWDTSRGKVYINLCASEGGVAVLSVAEPTIIEAAIDIDPDTLNLKSKGQWITCYIWLPEEYDVADVDPDSILLNGEIGAAWSWIDEAEQMLMVKFSRSDAQDMLEPGEVELTVSGELTDGTKFEGSDTIRVIDKGGKK